MFQKLAVYDGHVNHRDSEQFEKEKEKGEDREKNEWERDDSFGHKIKSARHDDCANNQFHRGRKDVESMQTQNQLFMMINVTCLVLNGHNNLVHALRFIITVIDQPLQSLCSD